MFDLKGLLTAMEVQKDIIKIEQEKLSALESQLKSQELSETAEFDKIIALYLVHESEETFDSYNAEISWTFIADTGKGHFPFTITEIWKGEGLKYTCDLQWPLGSEKSKVVLDALKGYINSLEKRSDDRYRLNRYIESIE